MNHLRQAITQHATTLGFLATGFVPVTALTPTDKTRLQAWLANGYHGGANGAMPWMESPLRQAPEALVPEAGSIIMVLSNYHQPQHLQLKNKTGKIAQYAWGKDYHKVLRKKLKQLLAFIQTQEPNATGRVFTDSAPILEKTLAEKAGLGWQGKNSLLLNAQYGSYTFIGSLFINLPLAEEQDVKQTAAWPNPQQHPCGSCTKCLEACPTQAFVKPFVLDATKCIAYWTIEQQASEPLPEAIAKQQNGWLFGCDDCQTVCPWNVRFAQPTQEEAFTARLELTEKTPEEWLAMSPETFNQLATNTPLRRTGLAGLQRNAQTLV